jgi:hypothetical protein
VGVVADGTFSEQVSQNRADMPSRPCEVKPKKAYVTRNIEKLTDSKHTQGEATTKVTNMPSA